MKQSQEAKPLKSALKKYSSEFKKRVTWDPDVREPLPRRRKRKCVSSDDGEDKIYLPTFFKRAKKTSGDKVSSIFSITSDNVSKKTSSTNLSNNQKRIVWFNPRSYESNPYFQAPIRVNNSCCI